MRKLIIVRGAMGSGKSTLIREAGLTPYAISQDDLRQIFGAPVLNRAGNFQISQEQNDRVFKITNELIEERMERGETLIYDATMPRIREIENLLEVARRYRYETLCVDLGNLNVDIALKQNRMRDPLKIVPDEAILRYYETYQPIPDSMNAGDFRFYNTDHHSLRYIENFLAVGEVVFNPSFWKRVVHIGDIQGCYTALMNSPAATNNPETFYVFVGDFCDRGIENAAVLKHLIDNFFGRDNVVFVRGNHEIHLERLVDGLEPVSREFRNRTLPEIEASDLDYGDIAALVNACVEIFQYSVGNKIVQVTHGGLPCVVEHPYLVSSNQLLHGTGAYSDPVDEQFDRWAAEYEVGIPMTCWQVHGHRNSKMRPILEGRSLNLEGSVEYGGHLRCAILENDEWTAVEVPNRVFRSLSERLKIDHEEKKRAFNAEPAYAKWLDEEVEIAYLETKELRDHKMIRERVSEAFPRVSAFNFTKEAFFDKAWDETNVKARGLFLNTETHEVVARGWEKFFNWGERADTTTEALREKLVFPVTLTVKENGFLGLAGYDAETDKLFLASKSTTEGPFAEMFREILLQTIGEGGLERLRRFCRDQQASCAFEVVDPVRDPHIESYENPKVVLLDVIRRSMRFQKMTDEEVIKTAKYLGVEAKAIAMRAGSFDVLMKMLDKPMNDMTYRWKGRSIEGFVIEDFSGYHVKVKTSYYSFWKKCRGLKDRIATGKPVREAENPLAKAFQTFCERQCPNVLALPIITLREAFLADPDAILIDPETGQVPLVVEKIDEGFNRALDAMAERVASGNFARESVARILMAANNEVKIKTLSLHPQREFLVAAARDI